jgi:hypothetical protein
LLIAALSEINSDDMKQSLDPIQWSTLKWGGMADSFIVAIKLKYCWEGRSITIEMPIFMPSTFFWAFTFRKEQYHTSVSHLLTLDEDTFFGDIHHHTHTSIKKSFY